MTITAADLQTLTVAYQGQPFVHISVGEIDTFELDTAYLGQPFVAEQLSVERETEAQAAGAATVLGQSLARVFSEAQATGSATVAANGAAYAESLAEASGVATAEVVSAVFARVEATSVGGSDVSGSAVGYRFGDMKQVVKLRKKEDVHVVKLRKKEDVHVVQQRTELSVALEKKYLYMRMDI